MKRIFIQIASYRDDLLTNTIRSAIFNAKYPDRLHFGICLQDEFHVINQLQFPNVRIRFINYHKTKGIGWARHQAQKLYRGEEYVMQIDSHMQFEPNWDSDAIEMLGKKTFLSQFCPDWHNASEEDKPYANAAYYFDNDLYPYYLHICLSGKSGPQHAFICAHFIFAPGRFFQEVPIDPKVGFYYEENAMTLRAWTSGWDIYLPNKIIARHTWNRKNTWDDETAKRFEKDRLISSSRFSRLIGASFPRLKKYSLGNERTLDQYYEFSGVNFNKQTIKTHAKRGEVC